MGGSEEDNMKVKLKRSIRRTRKRNPRMLKEKKKNLIRKT